MQAKKVLILRCELWQSSDGRTYTVARPELDEWIGKRAEAGKLPPRGFPKGNRFG